MNHPEAHGDSTPSGSTANRASVSVEGTAPGAPQLPGSPQGKQRDELLQIFRRLDWRFLLPHPGLRHVAFLGDDDPQLTQGLRRTSRALSLLDLHWRFAEGQEPRFDVVVLRSPRLRDAERVSRLVQPGGCLYWEIEHLGPAITGGQLREHLFSSSREKAAPRNLPRLRRQLSKLGFTNVCFHWHRPSFREAVEIVPLEGDHILDFVLDGRGARFPGRVKRFGARCLRRLGLLRGFVPCLSVTACKRPSQEEA